MSMAGYASKETVQGSLPPVHEATYGAVTRPDPAATVHTVLLAKCDEYGDKVCMIEAVSGKEWTFKQLAEQTRALAGGLASMNAIKSGDMVAIYLPNIPEYFAIFTGVMALGGVNTTINPAYGEAEMEHAFSLTLPKYVFTTDALLPNALAAVKKIEGLECKYILMDEKDKWTNVGENVSATAFSEVLKPGSSYEEATDSQAVSAIPYSSGTTGMPKGVMLTHYTLLLQLYSISSTTEILGLTSDDTITAVLPFYHIYGMMLLMMNAIYGGAKVVVFPKFDPKLYLQRVKEFGVTHLHIAPPMANFLAKNPLVDEFLPLPSIKTILCAAAPLGSELAEDVKNRTGCKVLRQGYGMTELSGASHIGPVSNAKSGSVGVLTPFYSMKLINEEGKPVTSAGERGEVWYKSDCNMKGYYKNEEATQETIDSEGFLHTGDVGELDEDGQLWIVDRIKELIKVKGYQVAPAELEAILMKHPRVNDAAVIGVAAGYQYGGKIGDGQVPKAFIVKKDESLTEDEVKEFVKTELKTVYKQLGGVEFVDSIPKSPSGKILRKDLRKMEEANGGKVFG